MKCEHKRNGTSELCSAPSNILYEQNNLGIRDSEKKSSKKMGMCPQGACEIDPKRAFKRAWEMSTQGSTEGSTEAWNSSENVPAGSTKKTNFSIFEVLKFAIVTENRWRARGPLANRPNCHPLGAFDTYRVA